MRILFLFLSLLLLTTSQAYAGGSVYDPTSVPDYSAEEHMETDSGEMVTDVFHSGKKERREMKQENGDSMITITRMDKKVMWMLMPKDKMYMEHKLDDGKSSKENVNKDFTIETETLGEETVNGVKATKRKSIITDKDGNKFGGFVWTSKEGIVVKNYFVAKTKDGKMNMKSELKNLKVGKQDSKLFELPDGYKPMSFGNMMMQGGGDDAGSSKGKKKSKDENKPENGGKGGIDLNKLKKLF